MIVSPTIIGGGLLTAALVAGPAAFAQGSTEERAARLEQAKARMVEAVMAADTDADGFVSRAEYDQNRADQFTTMDADGDGALTEADRPERPEGAEAPPRGGRFAERARQRMQERAAEMDGDGDGAVSQDEFVAGGEARFVELDANGDGALTLEEVEAAPGPRRGGRFGRGG